jgi:hypothetical protein
VTLSGCAALVIELSRFKATFAGNDCNRRMTDHHPRAQARLRLGLLIAIHIVISCVSLIYVAASKYPNAFNPAEFHIFYDPSRWYVAVAAVAAFAFVACLFPLCDFSIGWFVGFFLYTMVLGYLWLNCFTDLNYDHLSAGLSAAASAVAFLLPALFIVSPIRQTLVLSAPAFDRLTACILLLAVAVIAIGAGYNFRLVGVENIYDFRAKLEFPTLLNYLIGTVSSALLPFAFAGFVARRAHWRAGAVLLLLLLFYPITLSKFALFTPCWLVGVLLMSKLVEARAAIVLSLLIPILAGLVLVTLFGTHAVLYFATVNFRMIAIPSVGLDVYNDFFSRHDLTYFCQISPLKRIMQCSYRDQLAVVMQNNYKIGSFNASLFATEGIASLGVLLAPVAVFICGLVIALGNRLSAGLPPAFILISGAMLPLTLLNVPLTTVLLTHGAGLLFLLWYVTPRSIFEPGTGP